MFTLSISFNLILHTFNLSQDFISISEKYENNFILDGLYAYAKGGTAILAEGNLISAEVEEYNEHPLSFSYWKSNNISKLDVSYCFEIICFKIFINY